MRSPIALFILAASLSTLACGPRDSDKLGDDELAGAEGSASAEADSRCDARTAQDEVKRQLFVRAAEIRGGNGDDYARIADFAVFRSRQPRRGRWSIAAAAPPCACPPGCASRGAAPRLAATSAIASAPGHAAW